MSQQQYDEYGVLIKPKASAQVDDYGIPIKKKVDGGANGTTSEVSSVPATSPSTPPSGSQGNGNVFDFNKNLNQSLPAEGAHTLQTLDGAVIPYKNDALPKDALPQVVNTLQKKIDTKSVSPEDIQNIAQSSGKSVDVIQAYIDKGAMAGQALDIKESYDKQLQDLKNNITSLNHATGTSYNPEEDLSTAQKSADFLHAISNNPLVDNTNQLNSGRASSDALHLKPIVPQNLFNSIKQPVIEHVVNQTVAEDYQNAVPKEQTIAKIYKRIDPVGYREVALANAPSVSIPGVPNPIADVHNLISNTEEENNLIDTQRAQAELMYNDGLRTLGTQTKANGITNGDQNMVNAGDGILAKVDNNVMDKYPSLVKAEMARQVNEEIARETGVVQGSETQSGHRLERVFGSGIGDRYEVMKNLGFFDDPKKRDLALQLVTDPSYFADNSLLGGAVSSFIQPFKELGFSAMDVTGLRTSKDRMADKIKEQLFPKDFSNDPNNPLKTDVSVTRNVVNTTANLAGMMTIAALTEGIAGEAGLGLSAAERTSLASSIPEAERAALLKKVSNVGQNLGAWTSFGMPSMDASLKDSKNFLDSEPSRYLYATMNAVANTFGGKLLDLGKIVRIPEVSDVFAKIASGSIDKTISEDAAKELLNGAKNKYVDFAMKYGNNVTKGAATMAYFGTMNSVLKLAFGDQNTKAQDILPNAGHAFLDGLMGMSIMGGFGAAADMKNEQGTSYKSAIYGMALNHDATKSVFQLGLKNGQYDQNEYNKKVQVLNTAKAAKDALDATIGQTGIKLDQNQKAVYVANKTAEGVLRNKAMQEGVSEGDKTKYLAQADKLKEQSTQVLDGLKFTPYLEPLYDLHKAEQDRNAALDELNSNPNAINEKAYLDKNQVFSDLTTKYFTDNPGKTEIIGNGISEEDNNFIKEAYHNDLLPSIDKGSLTTNGKFDKTKVKPYLKQIAQQAQGVDVNGNELPQNGKQALDNFGYPKELVKIATDAFPKESLLRGAAQEAPADKVSSMFDNIKPLIPEEKLNQTQDVLNKVSSNGSVNENDLKAAEDNLYAALDKAPEAGHLIEPLILKLQNYPNDLKTKTETRTVTESVPIEGAYAAKSRTEVKPILEQGINQPVTVTDTKGNESRGVLRVEDGNYIVSDENGNKVAAIGEKAINNRDLTLPSEMDNPIEFDKNGNVKSVTVQVRNGSLVKIENPEKALDIAIQLQAEKVGTIPDAAFEKAYKEVQKEVKTEVPVSKKEKTGIAFAPYREKNVATDKQDAEIRNSPDYKLHMENLKKIADGLGIKILSIRDTWGGYVDKETDKPVQEVSNVITVEATPEQAKLMAAILGKSAPEMQDSVLVGTHNDKANGTEVVIHTGSFEDGKKAIEHLKNNGLEYFTVDKKTGDVIILDTDNTIGKNIVNFISDLQKNNLYNGAEQSKIEAEFVGQDQYDNILNAGSDRGKTRSKNGFDINAFIQEAKGKYEKIKSGSEPPPETKNNKLPSKEELSKYSPEDKKAFAKAQLMGDTEAINKIIERNGNTQTKSDKQSEIKTDSGKMPVEQYVSRAKAVLESLFPKAKFETYDKSSDYLDNGGAYGSRGLSRLDSKGNRTIMLDLQQIRKDGSGKTAFHEVIHPIVDEVVGMHPEELNPLWSDLANQMKDVKGFDAVLQHTLNYGVHEHPAAEGITELLTQISEGNISLEDVPPAKKGVIIDLLNKILEKLGLNVRFGQQYDFKSFAADIKKAFDTGDTEALKSVVDKSIQKNKNASDNASKIAKILFGTDKADKNQENIIDKIKQLKDLGFSEEEIKGSLKDLGYKEDQIKSFMEGKTNSLGDSVKEFRDAGFTDQEIRTDLKANGYSEKQIDDAMAPPPSGGLGTSAGIGDNGNAITHAAIDDFRRQYGFAPFAHTKVTDEELNAEADKAIKNGYDVRVLWHEISKGHNPNDLEVMIMKKAKAAIDDAVAKNPSKANLKKVLEFADSSDIAGQVAGRAFRLRQDLDETDIGKQSLGDFFVTRMRNKGVTDETISDAQRDEIKKEYSDLKDAYDKLKKRTDKLAEEASAKKAEDAINRMKQRTSKAPKKTHEDYVKERQTLIEKLKAAKAKAIEQNKDIHTAGFSLNVTPEMVSLIGKIAFSHVSEGAQKLHEVSQKVFDEIKDVFEGITQQDVIDVLGGAYNEVKPEKNDVLKQMAILRAEAAKESSLAKSAKDSKKLAAVKKLYQRKIDEQKRILKEIEKGNPAPEKKPPEPIPLDREAIDLKDKYITMKHNVEKAMAKDEWKKMTRDERLKVNAVKALNIPRTIMSSSDFSAVLRQAVVPTVSHPVMALKSMKGMFLDAFSEKKFDRWLFDLKDSKLYDEMSGLSNVYISDPHEKKMDKREEAYMSNLIERIPYLGTWLVQGSERAYLSYLNRMRVELYAMGRDLLIRNGKTPESHPEAFKGLGSFVNNMTGRGGVPDKLELSTPAISAGIFAPRLIASRLNLLGLTDIPNLGLKAVTLGKYGVDAGFYSKLPPEIRNQALLDMGKFVLFGAATLALSSLVLDDKKHHAVELDPRSSDFGKIRVGDTRYDIWGGFQQYVSLFAREYYQSSKSVNTGRVMEFGGNKAFGQTRLSVLLRFGRGKLAPIPSMAVDFLDSHRTVVGDKILYGQLYGDHKRKEVTLSSYLGNHFLPMTGGDIYDALSTGDTRNLIAIPATIFGVGVQTFNDKK